MCMGVSDMGAATVRERKRRSAKRPTAAAREVVPDLSAFVSTHLGDRSASRDIVDPAA